MRKNAIAMQTYFLHHIFITFLIKCLRVIKGWKKVYQKSRNGTQNGKGMKFCVKSQVSKSKKSRKIERNVLKVKM